ADDRIQAQVVLQQPAQAADRRKTEAEPAAAVASRIVELVELFEDALVLLCRYPDTAVPDLDARATGAFAAGDDDPSTLRVSNGVRDQIRQHPKQQRGVGVQHGFRPAHAQSEPLLLC